MHNLPERTLRFEYPDDMDPAWNPRRPEFASAANSVSLIMPYAEPYFVKSVRSALPQLDATARDRGRGLPAPGAAAPRAAPPVQRHHRGATTRG